jgi:hypothetical protein
VELHKKRQHPLGGHVNHIVEVLIVEGVEVDDDEHEGGSMFVILIFLVGLGLGQS